MNKIEQIKGNLIVSCQALSNEPLYSSEIMGRMALAAKEGGAKGIRANSYEDIIEIKRLVDLPIIGIVKREYPSCAVYITPTLKEVTELINAGVEIIALDATARLRPEGEQLESLYRKIRSKYPNQKLMADCSTLNEAVFADRLGFDFIGTTLVGYTNYTNGTRIEANDFKLIQNILKEIKCPLIAEGNIDTPEKAKRVLELGCYSVVVGSAITRPQWITRKFAEAIENDRGTIFSLE